MEDVGILYGHLVFFTPIWHIFSFLVYFKVIWYVLPVLVSCSKNNLATLLQMRIRGCHSFFTVRVSKRQLT
jgi:hypothetical protein